MIDLELPLLLSREAMKHANTKLDFDTDCAEMLGEQVPLEFTSSGHYKIPLIGVSGVSSVQDVLINITADNWDENKRAIVKLHVQFGHATPKRLIDLLKDAGYTDKRLFDMVHDVSMNCNTCKLYKKVDSRPVVGFSLSKDFNDVVSMDLKTMSGNMVLHLIDHATRYSTAVVIPTKQKEQVVEKIFTNWVIIFGCPKKILFDNGGSFLKKCQNYLIRKLSLQEQKVRGLTASQKSTMLLLGRW